MAGFALSAVVLKQQGRELYCFAMGSEQLRQICYVTPRSHDDPEEIQRIVDPKRAKEIGEYIKGETSLLPNSIVVSLKSDVQITDGGTDGVKVLHFPAYEGKFAYILDDNTGLRASSTATASSSTFPLLLFTTPTKPCEGRYSLTSTANRSRSATYTCCHYITRSRNCPVIKHPSWTWS